MRSLIRKLRSRRREQLIVDDLQITRIARGGEAESVRWEELQEVSIVTTSDGPFVEDFFWVLTGTQGGCIVPNGLAVGSQLLERLQVLPGFDNETVMLASCCVDEGQWFVWRRG